MLYRLHKWKNLILQAKWDVTSIPIYEATARGRKVILFKTLLSNICINECLYCALRKGRNIDRISWDPIKLARITLELYNKRYIDGLFLSSGVSSDPDIVAERQIMVCEILRRKGFKGYIHLRLMPGVSKHLIKYASELADRIGINIEAPRKDIFDKITLSKADYKNDIIEKLKYMSYVYMKFKDDRKYASSGFLKGGIVTQVIVGLGGDKDIDHIKTMYSLYRLPGMKRVYLSAFYPVNKTPLQDIRPCPKWRELRLYQVSYLIRDYGFTLEELSRILDENGMLRNIDPKIAYAMVRRDLYPININEANYKQLLRIPGIGPQTALKIIEVRERKGRIELDDLIRILGSKGKFKTVMKYICL